ncbi:MAG: hypothetical protein PHN45_00110 [Methylococcales bacterium]|nr:hypothetical protein [Methylococcales bacterium]
MSGGTVAPVSVATLTPEDSMLMRLGRTCDIVPEAETFVQNVSPATPRPPESTVHPVAILVEFVALSTLRMLPAPTFTFGPVQAIVVLPAADTSTVA